VVRKIPPPASNRETNIALFMGLNDTYEHGITRGVTQYAKSHSNWRLYGYGWMFRPLEALEHWEGDGIIARIESPEDACRLASLRIPVVDVAGAYLHRTFHQVNNHDALTGAMAAEHLLSCGFKRFAYCGVKEVGWSAKRKSGFLTALGKTASEVPVFEESLPWWEQLEDSEHLTSWLRRLVSPIGIFACNDTAGLKLTDLCRKIELEVPDDVAILGVDNEDVLCEMAAPTLSSIALDCERIGFQAAALLDRLLGGEGFRPSEPTLPADQVGRHRGSRPPSRLPRQRIPPILIPPQQVMVRESTRIYSCEDPLVEQAVRYIRAQASGGLRVADILSRVAASRRSLEKRFRHHMGHSLHTEIVKTRIEYAKMLLRNSSDTVTSIAQECGFQTTQRFYAVFKEMVGRTPAGYRALLKSEGSRQ
jgi:LacI family transcriptional regulator